MSSFVKIGSSLVLSTTLALVGAGCLTSPDDERATDETVAAAPEADQAAYAPVYPQAPSTCVLGSEQAEPSQGSSGYAAVTAPQYGSATQGTYPQYGSTIGGVGGIGLGGYGAGLGGYGLGGYGLGGLGGYGLGGLGGFGGGLGGFGGGLGGYGGGLGGFGGGLGGYGGGLGGYGGYGGGGLGGYGGGGFGNGGF